MNSKATCLIVTVLGVWLADIRPADA